MIRRKFLYLSAAALATIPLYWTFKKWFPEDIRNIPGRMLGASYQRGHQILKMLLAKPQKQEKIGTVIIGGGISGLSVARQLAKEGYHDFLLLDLEDQTGGNSRFGTNKTGRFPLGAHYLPIPSTDLKELIAFLQEIGIVTHIDEKGLPHYNERHLCHDPEERLFINGHWQEGLIPHFGVPAGEQEQIRRFMGLMEQYKNAKGTDGKYAFDLPVDRSSADPEFRKLDQISMQDFLESHDLTSSYLKWYVEYCCKDDFGSFLAETSAWAGIHYFAARKGLAGNASPEHVLTWPEGNGWLADQLLQTCKDQVRTGCMVFSVHKNKNQTYDIDYIDYADQQVKRIEATKVVFSCPRFVQKHIRTNIKALKERSDAGFEYSTWVVSNLELNAQQVTERNGFPLAWDNVIYGSPSLGYINSTQQRLEQHQENYNFTWYYPLPVSGKEARKRALNATHAQWTELMLEDLKKVYAPLDDWAISHDVCVWGHAMVKPKVGFMWGQERIRAAQSIDNSLFFAHTDLSGMSIFEEGFMRGVQVAKELMVNIKHD